jgi:DUF1680 family protein
MLRTTGEIKYAEQLEESVYNHLLAAENPQTGCVSYYTALQGTKPYRCDQGYSCCLSSVPRGISLIPEMLGGTINDEFTVLMFENGHALSDIHSADGTNIRLDVKSTTKFPADGLINFDVNPSKSAYFTINFRVPRWSANFKAKIGLDVYKGTTGGLLAIKRQWSPGDQVEITFDMPVEVLSGGMSYPNSIAIKRGPQVLAIDKGLNTAIKKFSTVTIADNRQLTNANAALPADWDWKEAFYLDAKVNNIPEKLIMVPFAEAGQKAAELEVWINR